MLNYLVKKHQSAVATEVDAPKLAIITGLFLFILSPAKSSAQPVYTPPDSLNLVSEVYNDKPSATLRSSPVIAASATLAGEVGILMSHPWAVVVGKMPLESPRRLDGSALGLVQPTDLNNYDLNTLLICQPVRKEIIRLTRQLEARPPVRPQVGDTRFEPISVCADRQGLLFILNRADGDIWRVDRNGRAQALGLGGNGSRLLRQPSRLRYAETIDALAVLDGDLIQFISPLGRLRGTWEHRLKNVQCFAIRGRELWLPGEEVKVYDVVEHKEIWQYKIAEEKVKLKDAAITPKDRLSLPDILTLPIADVVLTNDWTLWIFTGLEFPGAAKCGGVEIHICRADKN